MKTESKGIIPAYSKRDIGDIADEFIDLLGACCVGVSRAENGDIVVHTDGGEASAKHTDRRLLEALAKLAHREICWELNNATLYVGENADPTQFIAMKTCQLVAFRNYTKKGFWQDAHFLLAKDQDLKRIEKGKGKK